jgi:pimeloyl-ACP methyl ester carboxylesterase
MKFGLALAVLVAALATAPSALACDGIAGARCGTVTVPLDRSDPGAGTTSVAYALVTRPGSESTVLFNPGGPGSSAIPDGPALTQMVPDRSLLLVDPRGTGRSDPVTCSGDASLAFGSHEAFTRAIGGCGRSLGARARYYGSDAVADDFEAVRSALGIDRLDLWGESYGTYLMPIYAARHPEHVRSIVLSGSYPIAFDEWGRDRLGAALRAIRLVCARTRDCDGDAVVRDVGVVASRLRAHPLDFKVRAGDARYRTRLDEGALAELVYAGGDASLYGRLPAALAAARERDYAPLRRLVEHVRLSRAALIADPGAASRFSIAQSFATQCHDYPRAFSYADPIGARRAAYEQARAGIDTAPFAPAGWTSAGFEAADTCLYWPADPTAAAPSLAGLPDVPTLVLSGDLDANTPSLAGREAAAQFAHASWVEIPNVGHTPTSSECGLGLALRFVATLKADGDCAGTGAPPAVAARPPLHAHGPASVLAATFADLADQRELLQILGSVDALRGGRYELGKAIRLRGVRVAEDARVDGTLRPTRRGYRGTLRIDGGTPLQVTVSGHRGRATGHGVRLAFTV